MDVTALPALAGGGITFCRFNNCLKLNASTIAMGAAILRRLPGSRLVLMDRLGSRTGLEAETHEGFRECGVDPGRIQKLPSVSTLEAHLKNCRSIEMALDTIASNGIPTTCEALWVPVPVVTFGDDRAASRRRASLLSQPGLEQLVAWNPQDGIDNALALAADIGGRSQLRSGLRERMADSPLRDEPGFARKMEPTYRGLWTKYCRSVEGGLR